MTITLCFDFGNTRLKCAVFADKSLQQVLVLDNDHEKTIQKLLHTWKPEKSILSSVIDHDPALEALLSQNTRFHKLDHHSKVPITTPVGKPDTIGADRLALVVAAVDLFPDQNSLVIGLGSAITYNYVNKYHEFMGGGISPGMEMRFRSLNTFTAKLPLVHADWNFPLIGYDTHTNILSGVILGMTHEIEGIIENYAGKYDNFNALLGGGDAFFISRFMKKKIFADPDLIFRGLYAINEFNQS
jgi:type III pantothenate kinase